MMPVNIDDGAVPWRIDAANALGAPIERLERVAGGDFAAAFRATLGDGRSAFVKTHADPPPGFFSTEANGLAWLREPGAVRVPEVLGASDDPPWLALEWIELAPHRPSESGEAAFGRALAALHAGGATAFGREDRRTTGSLAVPNDPTHDWPTFYAERRLQPLAARAAERGALDGATIVRLERLASRLDRVAAGDEPPARLHGDLWAGNRVIDRDGTSWLVDPAAHGGHREFDLAMMRLFGGFGDAVFAAYHEVTPLAEGWAERVPLHQLAPLVVHAIKFGGHYASAVTRALDASEWLVAG